MPGSEHAKRYALSACAIAGLELSLDREKVIDLLAEGRRLMRVDGLVREVSEATGVHPVTVYRFLGELESHGVVRRLSVQGHRAVLLACESADYLVCRSCGCISRLPEPEGFRAWEAEIARRTGFRLAHHWYEVSGICPGCAPSASAHPAGGAVNA